MTDVYLLYTTWPDGETAELAGRAAVEATCLGWVAAHAGAAPPPHPVARA